MAGRGGRTPLDPSTTPPMVIGLGNENRGDDACGLLVARLLRTRLGPSVSVLERDAEGTELLDLWSGRDLVVVVDAVKAGGPPGAVLRMEIGSEPLPTALTATSSHGVSLGQAVALGQVFQRLPKRLVLYGIEAANFDPGASLSRPVAGALETVAFQIENEIRLHAEGTDRTASRGAPHA
jgi:hydrogenase maturation protease